MLLLFTLNFLGIFQKLIIFNQNPLQHSKIFPQPKKYNYLIFYLSIHQWFHQLKFKKTVLLILNTTILSLQVPFYYSPYIKYSQISNPLFLRILSHLCLILQHHLIVLHSIHCRVVVNSENLSETTFAGPGAGRFPTANSVMNDLIRYALRIIHRAEVLH